MTSVCYIIVYINLLYSFVQAKIFSPSESWELKKKEQELYLNSISEENQDEYLAETITPLWNLTYDEQLEKKQNRCSDIIDMMVKQSDNLKNLMTYKILPIVPSPVTEAYRNRDVFHIAHGVDGNPKTVGCLLGNFKLGRIICVRPTKVVTIKESHKRVAQVYEDFIRLSHLPACVNPRRSGHWNTLLVRSNEAGDVMAFISVDPKGFSNITIQNQQRTLKEYFFKHLPNITLFHQQCPNKRCTHEIAPFILLYGKRNLMETLCGYKFKISPEDSIFPNNKLSSEVFYDIIIKRAKLKLNTTVLDLYSGTGINSIVVSRFVKEAFGLESFPQGNIEAKYYVDFNNIHNVKFLMGRVNDNLVSVLENITQSSDVVALMNHRRGGLGSDVIKTIRKTLQISRLLYIFYKPNSRKIVQDFVDLCSNNNSKFPPFRLTKVIPIDLFPQTTFVELIFIFHREPITNI